MMVMERWRPFGGSVERWNDVSDIQQEVNRLFDSFFGRPAQTRSLERFWAPLADMYETTNDLVLKFEVPGVSEKDLGVSITGDVLTLKGERKLNHDVKDETYHRLERVYGKFERAIPLPIPVQADRVKATYRDGVLEVTLPKAEEIKPREIRIDIL
jgi:HSP20 family protein